MTRSTNHVLLPFPSVSDGGRARCRHLRPTAVACRPKLKLTSAMNQFQGDTYYHYTSVAACFAILSSRSIWLTDYRFLNDKKELHQGLSSFLAQLPDGRRASFERAFRWHDMWHYQCVFSLSRSPRILSQWRAYASDGSGMAVGFRRASLEFAGISLVDCRYEDHESYASELLAKHFAFVEAVHEASAQHVAENDFMGWVEGNRAEFNTLCSDLIALKNPAFAEEQEVRAIWSRRIGEMTMRTARDLIIPHVVAKIWPDDERPTSMAVVVPEVWLGPKCSELNRTGLFAMNMGPCMVHRHDCGYV